jgi:hypothetical protein
MIQTHSMDRDEINYETVPVGPDFTTVPTISGMREITITCQVYSRDQRPGYDAITYLEKARVGLYRPVLREALNAAGIAVLRMQQPVIILDSVFDNMYESRGSLDIIFGLAENVTFATDDEGYILRTEVSSDLSGIKDSDENITDEIFGVPV